MTKRHTTRAGPRRFSRSLLLVLYLPAILTTVGLLAYQAVDAARSQRHSAEQVLRDYAGLAAGRYVNRFTTQWIYQVIDPIYKALVPTPWPEVPTHAAIGRPLARDMALSLCRIDLDQDQFWSQGPQSAALFREEFGPALRQGNWPEDAFFFVLASSSDPDLLFFFHFPDSPEHRNKIEGFTTHRSRMQTFFAEMAKRPIMPVSLGEEPIDNRHLMLEVLGAGAHLLFRTGAIEDGIFFERHWERGLAPWTIRVTLDPEIADQLIIGGLPKSRLPMLIILLSVTCGLVLLTWWQWQREGQLNQRQADSLVAISHELRTPLAQIAMFSETLLLDRVRSPEERRRSLKIIHGESQRLTHLVDNAVYFSLSLHQPNRVQPKCLDAAQVLEEQIDFFHSMVDNLGTQFDLQLTGTPPLWSDPTLCRRTLRNLIDNALKYGPAGQTITLGGAEVAEGTRLWVEDQGKGIETHERALIWERFARLTRHRQSAVAGSGIGLWLVQRMMLAQGGAVWVEAGKTGGARFVLLFPHPTRTNPQPAESPAGDGL